MYKNNKTLVPAEKKKKDKTKMETDTVHLGLDTPHVNSTGESH